MRLYLRKILGDRNEEVNSVFRQIESHRSKSVERAHSKSYAKNSCSTTNSSTESKDWFPCDERSNSAGIKKHLQFDNINSRNDYRRRKCRRRKKRKSRNACRLNSDSIYNTKTKAPNLKKISFSYVTKLFQPWLWRSSKTTEMKPFPTTTFPDDDDSDYDSSISENSENENFSLFIFLFLLLLLIAIGAIIYVVNNPQLIDSLGIRFQKEKNKFKSGKSVKNKIQKFTAEEERCRVCGTDKSNNFGYKSNFAVSNTMKQTKNLENYLKRKAQKLAGNELIT
ncbi:hypothetical protein PGB90_000436 [Kerria lacca]